ncbi:MAG: hypothetical protein ACW99F_04655 [Candidatus Hodarchaeales archaeon]|jgi:hypothetical protein
MSERRSNLPLQGHVFNNMQELVRIAYGENTSEDLQRIKRAVNQLMFYNSQCHRKRKRGRKREKISYQGS